MNIPMMDLTNQYQSIKKDIDDAIAAVISETAFVGGRFVEELEKNIADYCQTEYAVALNSGTDALYLALWALGISKGDEVIVPAFSFFATAEVVSLLAATPIFVDIETRTFNIDADLIESKITDRTKAIMPVHLYGYPAEMEKINDIAKKHNLFVVEDACQAIGAIYQSKKAGNLGDIGCFSFYPTKNLGAYGDGGIITTNNKKLADKVRKLRNHGCEVKYHNDEIGVSSRLDGIQAAIVNAKLKYLDDWNKRRAEIAEKYNKLLKDVDAIQTPEYNEKDKTHIFHQYTIRVLSGKRDELKSFLDKNGIKSEVYYPIPLHKLPAYKDLKLKDKLPVVEKAAEEALSIPLYPELTQEEIEFVADKINEFFA